MKCHLVRQLFSFIDRFLNSWKGSQMILSRMKNEAYWADSSFGLTVACEGAKWWARDGASLADPLFSLSANLGLVARGWALQEDGEVAFSFCLCNGGKSLSFARRRRRGWFGSLGLVATLNFARRRWGWARTSLFFFFWARTPFLVCEGLRRRRNTLVFFFGIFF